jgi:hypothetical protein
VTARLEKIVEVCGNSRIIFNNKYMHGKAY